MPPEGISAILEVPVFRGDIVVAHAIIDAGDARIAKMTWKLHPVGYAFASAQGGGSLLMHRVILGLSKGDGLEVDHINRDKLDNRRSNLRTLTHAENRQNNSPSGNVTWNYGPTSSNLRGVSWDKRRNRWKATATVGGHTFHLGRFDSEAEAHAAATKFRAEHMPFAE